MVVGTTIFKLDGNPYHSPSFPRGGLAGTFVVRTTHVSGSPTVTITVEHRNAEDTSFSSAGTFANITATGTTEVDLSSLKEIVRFKYEFDVGDDATDAIHFVMQLPSWRPY